MSNLGDHRISGKTESPSNSGCFKIDSGGSVTLRHNSRLHHIGIGRTHTGTCVILLIQDLHIRIVNAATGELLRELILDPRRDYQPAGRTPPTATAGPTKRRSGLR